MLLCLLLAVVGLVYPVFVIRPFRGQGPAELQAALAVLRWRRPVEALLAAVTIFALVVYWRRQPSRWKRAGSIVNALVVLTSAALCWVNVYEIMFHPLPAAEFAAAGAATLDGDEQVIAVTVNGAARAYPIRAMAYHHLVNDTLGGTPIVPNY
jgi:hypothetical protein